MTRRPFRWLYAPRTPVDAAAPALVLVALGGALLDPTGAAGWVRLRNVLVPVLVYFAAASVAGRPGGARWAWPVFPLALALAGLHAAWAFAHGAASLRVQARAADAVWGSHGGLLVTLLVALPVSVGLSMDAGHRAARRAARAAAVIGALGIALHLAAGPLEPAPYSWLAHPGLDAALLAIAGLALAALARRAWSLARARRAETPRWIAIACTCAVAPLLPLLGLPVTGATGSFLVALGGGLVAGTPRARARDAHAAEPGTADADDTLAEVA